MSAPTPPPPDGERWAAGLVSSNGATSSAWTESIRRLVVLGYITAIAIPPVGFIIAIYVGTRPTKTAASRHWVWIVVVSLLAALVWTLVFVSGALTSTSNDLS